MSVAALGLNMTPRYPLLTPDEQISRLEAELDFVRYVILNLMPDKVRTLLTGYYSCESRDDASKWQDGVVESVIRLAMPLPEPHASRANCPLCGDESASPFSRGFQLDEGLRRHLTGWGNARQCGVTKVVFDMARETWNAKFRDTEERERAAKQALRATREATEPLFKLAPKGQPELLDAAYGAARDEAGLIWAEERLTQLGFKLTTTDRVRTYTREHEEFIVYADPRRVGEITFAPFNRSPRGRRVTYADRFVIRDNVRHDISGKYDARITSLTDRLHKGR